MKRRIQLKGMISLAKKSEPTMSKSYYEHYNDFANACDIPRGTLTGRANVEAIKLAQKLVVEEWEIETKDALAVYLANPSLENLVTVADGIGDTIYVLCQLARSLGLPLDSVFLCIQYANMSKVGPDGKVRRREDGKILKPEGFVPPDQQIWEILRRHQDLEVMQRPEELREDWTRSSQPIQPQDC